MVDRLINATDVLNTALNTYPSTMLTTNTAAQNVTAFAADVVAAATAGKPLWIKPGIYPFGATTTTVADLSGTNGLKIIGNGAVLQIPATLTTANVFKFTTESGWTTTDVSTFNWSVTSGGSMATVGEVSSLTLASAAAGMVRGEMVSIFSSDPIPYGYGDGVMSSSQWELNWNHEMSQILSAPTTTTVWLNNKTRRNFTTGAPRVCKFRRYNSKNIKLEITDLILDTITDTWTTNLSTSTRPKFVFEIFGFYNPIVDSTVISRSVWQGDFVFAYTVNAFYGAKVIKAPNKLTGGLAILGYCPGWYGANLKPRIGPRTVQSARHATTIWSEAGHSVVNGITWVPKAGQVGNGFIDDSFSWATVGTPQVGLYTITMDTATTFTVRDPTTATVGTGTVGQTFNNQIKFVINMPSTGAVAFAATDRFDVTVAAHPTLSTTTTLSHSIACGNPGGAATPGVGDIVHFEGVSGTLGTALNGNVFVITGYTPTTVSFNLNSTGLTGFGGEMKVMALTSMYPAGGIHYGQCDGLYVDGGSTVFPSGAQDDEHENAIGSIFRNRSFFGGAALSYEDTNGRPINNRGPGAIYDNYDITGFAQVAQFHSFAAKHGVENYIVCRNFNIRNESNRAGAGAMFLNFAGDANVLTDKRKLILDGGTISGGFLVFLQNPLNGPECLVRNWTFSGDWGDQTTPTKSMFMIDNGVCTIENSEFDFTDMTTASVGRIATLGSSGVATLNLRNCHIKNMKGTGKGLITMTSAGCTVNIDNCTVTYDPNATSGTVGQVIDPGGFAGTVNIRGLSLRNVAKIDATKGVVSKTTGTVVTGIKENITGDAAFTIVGSAGSGTVTLTAATAGT